MWNDEEEKDVLVLSLSWDGSVDCLQSDRFYPDPFGCAAVRFKKQADLVCGTIRRKRMFWFYLCLGMVLTACSLTGFILTRLGVRLFDLKSRLTWHIER